MAGSQGDGLTLMSQSHVSNRFDKSKDALIAQPFWEMKVRRVITTRVARTCHGL